MFSTGRFRRVICAYFFCLCVGSPSPLWAHGEAEQGAQPAEADAALYRVFLRDGSTVVSYGEFARVADRIVVSVPLGATAAGPELHLVSLPSDSVDWEKTDAYAEAVRASRYASTRGADDFALLSGAVSTALTDIALVRDPDQKIAMAAEARRNVTRWVAEHYGYRAHDVAGLAGLFDDVVAQTRAAAGVTNVDLGLIANLAEPPSMPLLPPPTVRERVEQAWHAAALAPDATERTSLLHGIDRLLADGGGAGASWTTAWRTRVTAALAVEARASRGYAALTRVTLRRADRHARRGDVTGVERVIRRALGRDDRLGQRRPQEMAALLATLDGKLDAARRLRLARDSRAARADEWRRYHRAVAEPLAIMRHSRDALDQIRRLAGPSRASLSRLASRTARATTLLAAVGAPGEGAEAHALLKSAIQLASRAAQSRQQAVTSGDMQPAWEASAAASGALMLFDRAAAGLKTPPTVRKATRRP